jgi:hypothetical protein
MFGVGFGLPPAVSPCQIKTPATRTAAIPSKILKASRNGLAADECDAPDMRLFNCRTGSASGATMIASASSAFRSSLASQTSQMKFASRLKSFTSCSSQMPSERNCARTSGDAANDLMQTVAPTGTRLKGQTSAPAQLPLATSDGLTVFFTAKQNRTAKMAGQVGF